MRTKTRSIRINKVKLKVLDYASSLIPREVRGVLRRDGYGIEGIPFREGDVVIDIGANVGIVSMYLAKRFPFLRILGFEPVPQNFAHFVSNLEINDIRNVEPFPLAITSDGRFLPMIGRMSNNSGGCTAHLQDMHMPAHEQYRVPSITLDEVFAELDVDHCRFLKVDCEGSEHEILLNTSVLDRVDYLGAEFHINSLLRERGYSNAALEEYCRHQLGPGRVRVESLRMAE